MFASKNRIEAFSDGVIAIILTILVLELKVPTLQGTDFHSFIMSLESIAPKILSFAFSFFVIAIFWVNHHSIFHQIKKIDMKLLWMNIVFLFTLSMFPFLTAFVGDYVDSNYTVALYAINMFLASLLINLIWQYVFIKTDLAGVVLTEKKKRKELKGQYIALSIDGIAIVAALIYVPVAWVILIAMPFFFIMPKWFGFSSKELIE